MLPNSAIRRRMKDGELDMRYCLLTMRKDRILQNETCGRKWSMDYSLRTNFPPSIDTMDMKVTLQPAFAGISDMIYDRAVL